MEFEFDPMKSNANKIKHGIDFVEAQALWNDASAGFMRAREVQEELRFMAIGTINERCWSAVYVIRDNKIRLISVRRSRKREIDLYESK